MHLDRTIPRALNQSPKIIFLHIHKTAGMSLRGLFVKNYRDGRHFNTNLLEMTAPGWEECRRRVRALSWEELESHQVFKGHMPFGLHELLPMPARYITFLREPVARALSHYRMACRKNELSADHPVDPSRPDWNLGCCPTLARSIDNGQTRALAGAEPDLPFGGCNAEHLRKAKKNLDTHFEFVGLTEHFDLSLLLLGRVCGWKWHFYVPDNVTPRKSASVSAKMEESIRTLNSFDLELYRYAKEHFRLLVAKYGLKLRLEHATFRTGNAIHQRLHIWRHARKERKGKPVRPAMRPKLEPGETATRSV